MKVDIICSIKLSDHNYAVIIDYRSLLATVLWSLDARVTDVERPTARNDGFFMIARLRGESLQ